MIPRLDTRILLALAIFAFGATRADAQAHFLRGDSNHDKKLDISDAVFSLAFLFGGGVEEPPCPDAADTDDSGTINITDAISLLGFLFQGGTSPAAPYPIFEADPTPDALGCLGTPVDISGEITTEVTLDSDHVYRLVSGAFVRAGGVLNIEAGTTVIGDGATKGLLVIDRGGRINAVGTETHPVVFTSDQPVGSRGRGNWGGIVLLGFGDNNVDGKLGVAEGLQGEVWGGGASPNNDDSSGRMRFVRIEYGGTEISPDNEVNALSMFGVGAGTQLDHIQCKYNLDDGFEWFGGAVSMTHLLGVGIGDDTFDLSFGFTGKLQFLVAQQRGDDCERGFENDNHEDAFGNRPLTNPIVANMTLVGDPSEGSQSDVAIYLRRGVGGRYYNGICMGFQDAGFDIDDGITTGNNPGAGTLVVDYCLFFDNKEPAETGETAAAEVEDATNGFAYTSDAFLRTMNSNNLFTQTAPVVDAYNLDAPNFRPQNEALDTSLNMSSIDSFFQPTTYRGAVAPTGPDWTQARWISYLQN